jgi:hypothetical protein
VPRLGHQLDDGGLSAGGLFLQRAFAETPSQQRPPTHG